MKNEGDTVKRFVCVFLILCLLPVCAFGGTLDDSISKFNITADLFGAPELNKSTLQEVSGKKVYTYQGGFVGFDDKGISISGNGETFLIYAICALSVLDGSNANFTDNCGLVMSNYLFCKLDGEDKYGITKGSVGFLISTYDNGFLFVAGR